MMVANMTKNLIFDPTPSSLLNSANYLLFVIGLFFKLEDFSDLKTLNLLKPNTQRFFKVHCIFKELFWLVDWENQDRLLKTQRKAQTYL